MIARRAKFVDVSLAVVVTAIANETAVGNVADVTTIYAERVAGLGSVVAAVGNVSGGTASECELVAGLVAVVTAVGNVAHVTEHVCELVAGLVEVVAAVGNVSGGAATCELFAGT